MFLREAPTMTLGDLLETMEGGGEETIASTSDIQVRIPDDSQGVITVATRTGGSIDVPYTADGGHALATTITPTSCRWVISPSARSRPRCRSSERYWMRTTTRAQIASARWTKKNGVGVTITGGKRIGTLLIDPIIGGGGGEAAVPVEWPDNWREKAHDGH